MLRDGAGLLDELVALLGVRIPIEVAALASSEDLAAFLNDVLFGSREIAEASADGLITIGEAATVVLDRFTFWAADRTGRHFSEFMPGSGDDLVARIEAVFRAHVGA